MITITRSGEYAAFGQWRVKDPPCFVLRRLADFRYTHVRTCLSMHNRGTQLAGKFNQLGVGSGATCPAEDRDVLRPVQQPGQRFRSKLRIGTRLVSEARREDEIPVHPRLARRSGIDTTAPPRCAIVVCIPISRMRGIWRRWQKVGGQITGAPVDEAAARKLLTTKTPPGVPWIEAADVAPVVPFLASNAAVMVSGAT